MPGVASESKNDRTNIYNLLGALFEKRINNNKSSDDLETMRKRGETQNQESEKNAKNEAATFDVYAYFFVSKETLDKTPIDFTDSGWDSLKQQMRNANSEQFSWFFDQNKTQINLSNYMNLRKCFEVLNSSKTKAMLGAGEADYTSKALDLISKKAQNVFDKLCEVLGLKYHLGILKQGMTPQPPFFLSRYDDMLSIDNYSIYTHFSSIWFNEAEVNKKEFNILLYLDVLALSIEQHYREKKHPRASDLSGLLFGPLKLFYEGSKSFIITAEFITYFELMKSFLSDQKEKLIRILEQIKKDKEEGNGVTNHFRKSLDEKITNVNLSYQKMLDLWKIPKLDVLIDEFKDTISKPVKKPSTQKIDLQETQQASLYDSIAKLVQQTPVNFNDPEWIVAKQYLDLHGCSDYLFNAKRTVINQHNYVCLRKVYQIVENLKVSAPYSSNAQTVDKFMEIIGLKGHELILESAETATELAVISEKTDFDAIDPYENYSCFPKTSFKKKDVDKDAGGIDPVKYFDLMTISMTNDMDLNYNDAEKNLYNEFFPSLYAFYKNNTRPNATPTFIKYLEMLKGKWNERHKHTVRFLNKLFNDESNPTYIELKNKFEDANNKMLVIWKIDKLVPIIEENEKNTGRSRVDPLMVDKAINFDQEPKNNLNNRKYQQDRFLRNKNESQLFPAIDFDQNTQYNPMDLIAAFDAHMQSDVHGTPAQPNTNTQLLMPPTNTEISAINFKEGADRGLASGRKPRERKPLTKFLNQDEAVTTERPTAGGKRTQNPLNQTAQSTATRDLQTPTTDFNLANKISTKQQKTEETQTSIQKISVEEFKQLCDRAKEEKRMITVVLDAYQKNKEFLDAGFFNQDVYKSLPDRNEVKFRQLLYELLNNSTNTKKVLTQDEKRKLRENNRARIKTMLASRSIY